VTEQEIRDWYKAHDSITPDQCVAWMAMEIAAQLARLNANLERKADEGGK
jgi:hypothetical protein